MDENEYRSVRDTLVSAPCVFEKTILALKTQCSKASRKNIAEREVVMCDSAHFAARCNNWLMLLRQKSQFALHSVGPVAVLPHGKEMKVQAGGMLGLCRLLELDLGDLSARPDVFAVLEARDQHFADPDALPFDEIVREVVHFRPR